MDRSSRIPVPAGAAVVRLEWLDALRGLAMLWMALFHFCFDLSHHGLLPGQNFYRDAFWLGQRLCIVSLFLGCAGAGQVLALQAAGGQRWPARFWRRWAQVAAGALLVTLGSLWMFPRSYISFGVLHAVAVMLLLLRLLAPLGRVPLGLLAGAALLLPLGLADAWFDSRWTNWIGLTTHKPITEDYVPLLPWFGVMALGWLLADRLLRQRPDWLGTALPAWLRPLARLGRWPLSFYLLHQPVLIGLVMAAQALGAGR